MDEVMNYCSTFEDRRINNCHTMGNLRHVYYNLCSVMCFKASQLCKVIQTHASTSSIDCLCSANASYSSRPDTNQLMTSRSWSSCCTFSWYHTYSDN